jgi:hypothetical protein
MGFLLDNGLVHIFLMVAVVFDMETLGMHLVGEFRCRVPMNALSQANIVFCLSASITNITNIVTVTTIGRASPTPFLFPFPFPFSFSFPFATCMGSRTPQTDPRRNKRSLPYVFEPKESRNAIKGGLGVEALNKGYRGSGPGVEGNSLVIVLEEHGAVGKQEMVVESGG